MPIMAALFSHRNPTKRRPTRSGVRRTTAFGPRAATPESAADDRFARVLGPLVEAHTHFAPERLPDGTVKVPWAASGRMSDGTVIAVAGTDYYTIDDRGLITNLINERRGLP
jgi:hypothetical protein